MQQPAAAWTERRTDPRRPQAFAFWIRPAQGRSRTSAWMLNISAGGAAFLSPAANAPPVGQRIALAEMQTQDRLVREEAAPLPMFARVLRHDDSGGVTQRLAIRFEADEWEPLEALWRRPPATSSHPFPLQPPLPPPVAVDRYGDVVISSGRSRGGFVRRSPRPG